MSCECAVLPEIVRVVDHQTIVDQLRLIEPGNWVRLCECPVCLQLWCVDEWDKLQVQLAIKLSDRDGWQGFDPTPLRKRFLLQARGGTVDEKCIWSGCDGRRVRGVVYCLDHLYATGARD